MVITTHVCRGNFRSTFISSGGYEPVAESLLGECNYDGYFLEYDTDRAGGFEPLRFLPKGKKIVVLGLVTSKTGTLEKQGRRQAPHRRGDEIRRRSTSSACRPQCGFASTEEGNVLAEDEQWAKLRDDRRAGRRGVGQVHMRRPDQRTVRVHHRTTMTKHRRLSAPITSAACCVRAALKEARAKREKGEIDAEALKVVEDREIEKIIKKQEEVGLQARHRRRVPPRSWWHFDFFKARRASKPTRPSARHQVPGVETKAECCCASTGKLGASPATRCIEHFKFVKAHTKVDAEDDDSVAVVRSISATAAMVSRSRSIRSTDDFYRDLGQHLSQGDPRLFDAGCRYLQLDDYHLVDDLRSEAARAVRASAATIRTSCRRSTPHDQRGAVTAKPADMAITMHSAAAISARPSSPPAATSRSPSICSTRSMSMAISWSTTATAPAVSSRCASCPKARSASCSGSSRRRAGSLEPKDEIKRRIDEATKFVALDQLCLSPQCGFASTEEGNVLAEDEQWAKLRDDRRNRRRGVGRH